MTILFTLREVLDIMEFRLGGLYLQEMRDLRGGGATLAEVFFLATLAEVGNNKKKNLRGVGATLAQVFFFGNFG